MSPLSLDTTYIILCEITGWKLESGHVEYEIECTRPLINEKWVVTRRYNDFYTLYQHLMPFGLKLPFPPKKIFGNTEPTFVDGRKQVLQQFLDKVLVHPLIYCNTEVMRFVLPEDDNFINDYYQRSQIALRNMPNYILTQRLPNIGWRCEKFYAQVLNTMNHQISIYSWTSHGPDSIGTPAELTATLKFLSKFNCPVLFQPIQTFVDHNGMGIISETWEAGSLRDQLYRKPPGERFLQKYAVQNECYFLNPLDIRFIARHVLEALAVLNSLSVPYLNIHCGNVRITGNICELTDVEFALMGNSSYNRPIMVRQPLVNSIEDMMVYSFGHLLYEMVGGVLVFPEHNAQQALGKIHVSFQPILRSIFDATDRLPTLQELMSNIIFDNISVARMSQRTIAVPGAVKAFLERLSQRIVNRLQADKKSLFDRERKEHFEELVHSETERKRRRELVLAELSRRQV